jgi:CSLREA domain-containing protein
MVRIESRNSGRRSFFRQTRRQLCRPWFEHLEGRNLLATITVNTVVDDLTPNDGSVSLREAIAAMNAGNDLGDPNITAQNPGTFGSGDTIHFNIGGSGVHTINVGTDASAAGIPLPTITNAVIIDGYSQPSASMNALADSDNAVILIELNGTSAGATANGLAISQRTTVQGLAIGHFGGDGIFMSGSSSNIIQGNFIGLTALGAAAGNGTGVFIDDADGITVGGTTPSARNVISGNGTGITVHQSTNTQIESNFIGTSTAGTNGIPNSQNGVLVQGSSDITIGGAASLNHGNVIAFNGLNGILVTSVGENESFSNPILSNSIFSNGALGIDLNGDGVRPMIPVISTMEIITCRIFPC